MSVGCTQEVDMARSIPTILNHISIGTNDLDKALKFYDAVMATIGASRQLDIPNIAVAYGKQFPEFWVQRPLDGEKATCANGAHCSFHAPSVEAVHAFYDAAIAEGGTSDGEPGPRPMYGPNYYGCFVRDLDGHKIETNLLSLD